MLGVGYRYLGRGMLRIGTGILWVSYRCLSRRMLCSDRKMLGQKDTFGLGRWIVMLGWVMLGVGRMVWVGRGIPLPRERYGDAWTGE